MAQVTMYTTATCPFCKMQMEYLDSKNVKYQRILVDEHPEEAQKMIAISGQMGVPFTVIDLDNGERETILGFDRKRIDEALGL
ncbi:glutaredoxin family protein [Candidatus Curtissbacteria bacterium]|nr:glutaredoxin family protein [Candidatus Curtissbacteria bacterium]